MKLTLKTNNIFIRMFFTLSLVFTILIASNFLYANTIQPPAHNAPAPINVSNKDQDKGGKLTLGGLLVNGGAYINNKVRANKYCDRNGKNCFSSAKVNDNPLPTCTVGQVLKVAASGVWACGTDLVGGASTAGVGSITYVTSGCSDSASVSICPSGYTPINTVWSSSCGEDGDSWTTTCLKP